jgi:hypothetical protein
VWDVLNRPVDEMGVLKEGEKGGWLRRVWTVLCHPLPGTRARPRPENMVWIEGRLTVLQFVVVGALIGLLAMWGSKVGFKALGEVIKTRLCEPGWGGYSLGQEIGVAILP